MLARSRIALHGKGNLRGGFKGRVAVASPRLVPGRCRAERLAANVAVAVVATRPQVDGPVAIDRFVCPASRIAINAARFDAKASFNESFTRVDGSGRLAISSLVAGANGLANFGGTLTYKGPLDDIRGDVRLSAQNSRLATIYVNDQDATVFGHAANERGYDVQMGWSEQCVAMLYASDSDWTDGRHMGFDDGERDGHAHIDLTIDRAADIIVSWEVRLK